MSSQASSSPAGSVLRRFVAAVSSGGGCLVAARIFTLVCSAAITGIASRYFPKPEFGIWSLVTPMLTIMLGFDLGVANAIRNRLAIEEQEDARGDFAVSVAFLGGLAVVYSAVLLGVYARWGFGYFFSSADPAIRQAGSLSLLLCSLLLLWRMPLYLGMNSFFSYREIVTNALLDAGMWLVLVVAVALAALFRLSVVEAAVFYQAAVIGCSAAAFGQFLRRRRWTLSWPERALARLRTILKKAAPFGLLQIVTLVLNYASAFAVGAVVGVAEAGPFRAALTLFLAVIALQFAYVMPLWSEFSFALRDGKRSSLLSMLRSAMLQMLALVPILALIVAVGPFVMRLWLGMPFDDRLLLFWLCLGTFAQILANTIAVFFNGVGKPLFTTWGNVTGAVLIVPLCLLFGRHGVDGVAAAIFAANLGTLCVMTLGAVVLFRRLDSIGGGGSNGAVAGGFPDGIG